MLMELTDRGLESTVIKGQKGRGTWVIKGEGLGITGMVCGHQVFVG